MRTTLSEPLRRLLSSSSKHQRQQYEGFFSASWMDKIDEEWAPARSEASGRGTTHFYVTPICPCSSSFFKYAGNFLKSQFVFAACSPLGAASSRNYFSHTILMSAVENRSCRILLSATRDDPMMQIRSFRLPAVTSVSISALICAPLFAVGLYRRWRAQGCHVLPFVSEWGFGETADALPLFLLATAVSFLTVNLFSIRDRWIRATLLCLMGDSAVSARKNPTSEDQQHSSASARLSRRLRQGFSSLLLILWGQKFWKCLMGLALLATAFATIVMSASVACLALLPWATHLDLHINLVTVFFVSSFLYLVGNCGSGVVGGVLHANAKDTDGISSRSILTVVVELLIFGVGIWCFFRLRGAVDQIWECQSYHGGGIRMAQRGVQSDFRQTCLLPLLVGCEPLRQMTIAEYQIIALVWAVALKGGLYKL